MHDACMTVTPCDQPPVTRAASSVTGAFVVVLLCWLCAGCGPDKSFPVAGSWTITHWQVARQVSFAPDGSYSQTRRVGEDTAHTAGRYHLDGATLVLEPAREDLRSARTGQTFPTTTPPPERYVIRWSGKDHAVLSTANGTMQMERR